MLPSRVKKNLLCTAIAAAAALGATGSVQAAVYRGSWDPLYGSAFDRLWWTGTSTFFIPDDCIVGNGTVNSESCTGMNAEFAQVDLYDKNNLSSHETLSFNQTVSVSQMVFKNGRLTGVDSGFFTPLLATLPQAGSGDYSFSLQFSSSFGAKLFYLKNDTADSDESGDGHKDNHEHEHENEHENDDEDSSGCNLATITSNSRICGVNNFIDNPANVTYTLAVPEPATFALVLAGLGALGLTMRRRRG